MSSLQASYEYCRKLTQERAKNFYFGIKLLPRERRDALCAIYAFFRYCDDVSDDEEVADRAELLNRWRAAVRDPEADENPILEAFHHAVERYRVPRNYFEELIDGTESDLTVDRFPTFDDTYLYCYRVASTVGLVCVHVFGFDGSEEALKQAEYRGIAFQLTNILRDLKEDADRGRIYLPLEDLERFGVDPASMLAGAPDGRFAEMLEFEVERARDYYRRSDSLAEKVEPESRASLEAMTRIYRALLEKVSRMGPEVMKKRAQLSKVEKLKLAGQALAGGIAASLS